MKLRQAIKIQNQKHRGCYTPDQLRKSDAVCWRRPSRILYGLSPIAPAAFEFAETLRLMRESIYKMLAIPAFIFNGKQRSGYVSRRESSCRALVVVNK